MKRLTSKIRNLLVVPSMLLGAVADVNAAPQYHITDLGTLGGAYSQGMALNEAGVVAGYANLLHNTPLHPVLWQNSVKQDLNTLGGANALAVGINNNGDVVGNSQILGDTATRAFLWRVSAMQQLSSLSGGQSRATAINDNGVMAGVSSLANNTAEHAVVWLNSAVTAPIDLGSLGGPYSQANDININGQVVGYAENSNSVGSAVLWAAPYTTAPQNLGTLGGTYSEAYAVNASGQVTGISSNTGDAQYRGFIWRSGQGMTDIGLLTATSTHTAGLDINTAGDIVGYSTTAGGVTKRAIFRKNGASLADLNGMILPNTGWLLSEARAINDAGQIVGIGTLTKVDTAINLNRVEHHGFLLTPDKVKPTITCPPAVTTTGIQPASIGQAVATDDLDTAPVVANNRPVTFPGGSTTVIWTATDANGNTAMCSQLVTIGGDSTPPVVNFQISPAAPGASGWYLTLPSLTWNVTDAESAISSRTGCVNSASIASTTGQTFTCAATSAGGTSATVSTPLIRVDNNLPVLAGAPANFTSAASTAAGGVVIYSTPTATDATSGVSAAGVSCSPASGSTFAMGATTVACNVSDNAGNSANASFVVTVADQTPPVITPTVTGTQGPNGWYTSAVNVSWNVSDAQSAISASTGCAATSLSANGINQTVTCAASSAGGTVSVSTQAINIDTIAPVFASCPATVNLTQGQTLVQPTATDNLTTPVITGAPGVLPVGTTTVTWRATDQAGLSGTCVQQVTVATAVTETIAVTRSQCKARSATVGEWQVQGTSSLRTNNSIQLYSTATVPADLTANRIGGLLAVSGIGNWQYSTKTGPGCRTPISLRSTAAGTTRSNIVVSLQ